jgi:arylsulfatase A-like enzyme
MCAIRRNDEVVVEKEYITTKFAKEAVGFIDRNKDKPFLLYVPFSAPHTPFQATKEYYDMFSHVQDKNKRVYYAMIKAMDDAVGMVMNKLKKEGLEENTIVFFVSDNGPATYTYATDNHPLKGGKVTNFEGGLNIPFMMQWKKKLPGNQVVNKLAMTPDIFTTVLTHAGVPLPEDRKIDGIDLVSSVLDTVSSQQRSALFWRSGYNKSVRKDNWKLILDTKNKKTLLYDLQSDREEKFNLAADNPTLVRELKDEIRNWEKGLSDPLWPRIMDFHVEIDGETYQFAM